MAFGKRTRRGPGTLVERLILFYLTSFCGSFNCITRELLCYLKMDALVPSTAQVEALR